MRWPTLTGSCLLFAVTLFAQADRGTITGSVQDPANSMVPGAVVVAKNRQRIHFADYDHHDRQFHPAFPPRRHL
jgi:hypothetical protein